MNTAVNKPVQVTDIVNPAPGNLDLFASMATGTLGTYITYKWLEHRTKNKLAKIMMACIAGGMAGVGTRKVTEVTKELIRRRSRQQI